ncbi:YcxB family protein [Sphingorhabdus sp. Alg231-15]|uniref:YcxB family protein n=1 Tax=Sphingorhabdus sp. Alg231-15 TaxID=1922222 RepID=UPI000D558C22
MTEKIIFTPTEDDLRAAYGLHLKQMGWKRFAYLLLFGLAIGIAMAAYDGFDDMTKAIGLVAGMTLWAGIVALVMSVLVPTWWVPRLSKKIYNQQKDLRLETTSWWDDEKLHSSNEQGHAHLTFADMIKWRADDKIVLLYRSDHLFNFLPARIFKDDAHKNGLIRRLQDAGVPGEEQT